MRSGPRTPAADRSVYALHPFTEIGKGSGLPPSILGPISYQYQNSIRYQLHHLPNIWRVRKRIATNVCEVQQVLYCKIAEHNSKRIGLDASYLPYPGGLKACVM